MKTNKQIQMSESFLNSAVLAVSGGFQDLIPTLQEIRYSRMPRLVT